MLPTGLSSPFPDDKENISIAHGEKQSKRNALIDGETNGSRRPLLQRVISSLRSPPRISITILTNPAKTRTRSVPPIREPLKEIHLPAAWSPSSPAPPQTYTIPTLSYAARTRSRPSIQHAHASSSSVRRSRSPLRITVLSDPAREKQRAEQHRPTQSRQNVSAATTLISILKKPGTDGKGAELNGQSVKGKVLLPEVVVYGPVSCEPQAKTDVHLSGTAIGTDTTGCEEILGVPAVNSRSRLDEDDLARYYPNEHAAEQIVRRLRSMVRSGSRLAAARRRERTRQGGQNSTTPFSSDLLIASRTSARTSTLTPTGKIPITPTPRDPYAPERSFFIL